MQMKIRSPVVSGPYLDPEMSTCRSNQMRVAYRGYQSQQVQDEIGAGPGIARVDEYWLVQHQQFPNEQKARERESRMKSL